MADLIDRKALEQRIVAGENEIITDNAHAIGLHNGLTLAQAMVINAPTVDAVPVVRCQYCQHWHPSGWCKLIGQEFDRWPAYYCAEGIRKES